MGLTISIPDPPIVHLDGHTASVIQPGSLVLVGSSNTSPVSVSWVSKPQSSLFPKELGAI